MKDKSIGIMQAYFFPYIGYFQLIDSVDVFVIYEYVSFRKKTWITRNRILDKGSGKPVHINIPVLGKSSKIIISEVLIDDNSNWKKKVLNLIYYNYKKSIYFDDMYPFLENIIMQTEQNLHKYNSNIIIQLCKLLDIQTNIIFKNKDNVEIELKNTKSVPKENIKSERIINLCNKYNSNVYVNPIGGTELYDNKYFKEHKIDLFFVETEDFNYQQFDKSFTPYLSIIDMLMHIGVDRTKEIIKQYKLI